MTPGQRLDHPDADSPGIGNGSPFSPEPLLLPPSEDDTGSGEAPQSAMTEEVAVLTARAEKKWNQLDVDGSGELDGEEVLALAEWVWCSFHPANRIHHPECLDPYPWFGRNHPDCALHDLVFGIQCPVWCSLNPEEAKREQRPTNHRANLSSKRKICGSSPYLYRTSYRSERTCCSYL